MSANFDQDTQLTHDKIQAEIAKLMAETAKINAEYQSYPIVIEKLRRETVMYPFIVGASVTLAIVAVVKLFL